MLRLSPELGEDGSAEGNSLVGAATSIVFGTSTYVAASSFSPASALLLVSALVPPLPLPMPFPLPFQCAELYDGVYSCAYLGTRISERRRGGGGGVGVRPLRGGGGGEDKRLLGGGDGDRDGRLRGGGGGGERLRRG